VIKIFSDQKFVMAGIPHIEMLYPFWGIATEYDIKDQQYDRYYLEGSKLFQITTPSDADFSVFPMDYRHVYDNPSLKEKFDKFCSLSEKHGLTVLIFFFHDSYEKIDIENSIIFRPSFFKSARNSNEFAMPAFCEDFIKKYNGGILGLDKKNIQPSVGFVGYAAPLSRTIFITAYRTLRRKPPDLMNVSPIRRRSLKALSKCPDVQKNVILRNSYFGGYNKKIRLKFKEEYIDNLFANDYTLCARGAGNFSSRFYETVSCGRIPLFINTDCVLPFDDEIDWKKYTVWVEEHQISDICEILREFHTDISNEEFEMLQKRNREIWEDYLSPEGFFSKMHDFLQNYRK